MRYLLIILLFCSCSDKVITYSLNLNVKEYENNVLKSCSTRWVTVKENGCGIEFLDLSLRLNGNCFKDSIGNKYLIYKDINDIGLIISAVSQNNKSYIISTKGKCQ